jgi:serine/threonine protein phosphatase PrpC
MRKQNAKIKTKFVSEAGDCLLNGDYFAFAELNDFACYVLADGMDDDPSGSAKTAVTEIIRLFTERPTMNAGKLAGLLLSVSNALIKRSKEIALEASVTVLVTDYAKFRYAQAGNVRLCHIRNGVALHESKDMSLSAALAKKGELPLDKVEEHEERHNLSCYLGQRASRFFPEVSRKTALEDGDIIALYTRGVWERLGAADIVEATSGTPDPAEWTGRAEDMLLSPEKTGPLDNYSFVAILAEKVYRNAENRKKAIKKLMMIGIPVLVVLIALTVALLVRHHMRETDIASMNDAWDDAKAAIETNNFVRASEKADAAYALAQKLKLSYEKGELGDLRILLEHIIAGDEAMRDKKYDEAHTEFEAAEEKSYHTDLQGADYIAARMELAADHKELLDLLDRADAGIDEENLELAEQYYLQAAKLAVEMRATDEKALARDGVKNARDLMAARAADDTAARAQSHEKRGDENPEIAAEQYRLAAELYREAGDSAAEGLVVEKIDKLETQRLAEEQNFAVAGAQTMEANGDLAFDARDYALAREQYLTAQSIYIKYGMTERSQAVGQKLMSVFEAGRDGGQDLALELAASYMSYGDARFLEGDYEAAGMLYRMAEDIYRDIGLLEEAGAALGKAERADMRKAGG